MDLSNLSSPTLLQIEAELNRTEACIEETQDFLTKMNSISEQKKNEILELARKIELIRDVKKEQKKKEYFKILTDKEVQLRKAIDHMKNNNLKEWDPTIDMELL